MLIGQAGSHTPQGQQQAHIPQNSAVRDRISTVKENLSVVVSVACSFVFFFPQETVGLSVCVSTRTCVEGGICRCMHGWRREVGAFLHHSLFVFLFIDADFSITNPGSWEVQGSTCLCLPVTDVALLGTRILVLTLPQEALN